MKWNFLILGLLIGCAHAPSSSNSATPEASAQTEHLEQKNKVPVGSEYVLICKAKKSRFQFGWNAKSLISEEADQNSVQYKFRAATKPAGEKGENLKVGECGWAGRALAQGKKENSQLTVKSLSDEATLAFYKIRTGKVFKLPVRKGKDGLVALPKSEVRLIR